MISYEMLYRGEGSANQHYSEAPVAPQKLPPKNRTLQLVIHKSGKNSTELFPLAVFKIKEKNGVAHGFPSSDSSKVNLLGYVGFSIDKQRRL
jgi:hypothetical protein